MALRNKAKETTAVATKETDWSAVTDFQTALKTTAAAHGAVVDASEEMGDGFTVLPESQRNLLAGRPILLAEWSFREGDFGEFVSIRVLVENTDGSVLKLILNDGSTGICRQLNEYSAKTGKFGALFVKGGLRVSEYTYDDGTGKPKPASTWYLAV